MNSDSTDFSKLDFDISMVEFFGDLQGNTNNVTEIENQTLQNYFSSECGSFPDLEKVGGWKFWISGVMTLATAGLGCVGNFVSLYILIYQSPHYNIFNMLLSSLCIADLFFLICNLLITPSALGFLHKLILDMQPFADCGSHVTLSISIFLTIAIAIERYQAVCFAHQYSGRNAQIGLRCLLSSYILPSVFFAVILNIPKIFEILPIGRDLEQNVEYLKFFMIYQAFHPLLTTILIPIIILIVINYKILQKYPANISDRLYTRRRTRSDLTLSRICFGIVIIFITCNLPRLAVGLYEIKKIPTILSCFRKGTFYFAPDHQWLGDFVGRYFVILNSSINFIIYCLVGSQFRKDLMMAITLTKHSTTPVSLTLQLKEITV